MAFTIFIGCSKDDDDNNNNNNNNDDNTIIIEEEEEEEAVFIEVDPNINDGVITFEETGPSLSAENMQPDDRSQGNWSRFGSVGENSISVEYADNPDKTTNTSDRVIKVTEPVGVESWAGFYFMLEENIVFPAGKEAISFHFLSPGPGHMLLKLEDELANGTEEKNLLETFSL